MFTLNRNECSGWAGICNITDDWMIDYNYERPHESLNDLPPKIYEQQLT
ncbi:MAG: transposase [Methylococcales bacterium]|nr:transposase [Methylococcales bacterium]MBT7108346.1 transposase [Methylococcales bacterium]